MMAHNRSSSGGPLKAQNACDFCRSRKRSCDRVLPKCSRCISKHLSCDYSEITIKGQVALPASGQQYGGVNTGTIPIAIRPTTQGSSFPATYFANNRFFTQQASQLPRVIFSSMGYISGHVGNPLAVTVEYYRRIHWWMPIVSDKLLYEDMFDVDRRPSTDLALLIFAMKVLLWNPSKERNLDGARSQAYLIAKNAIAESVAAGLLSLRLMQAQLLILVYELGHAIYPAASFSINECANYATELGVDKSLHPSSQGEFGVFEMEERRRAWWMLVIMDRFMQFGHPGTRLSTEEPTSESLLPSDDPAFSKGILPEKLFAVGDAATTHMGSFARMAQASVLLGRVYRHNRDPPRDEEDRAAEYWQLDRTLGALLNLAYFEGAHRIMAICGQTSICYSALIALHDPPLPQKDLPLQEKDVLALHLLKPVAHAMNWDSSIFLSGMSLSVEDASPFLLLWAYQAASIFYLLMGKYDSEALVPLARMKEKLSIMSRRWTAGEVYLKLLAGKEAEKAAEEMRVMEAMQRMPL